MKFSPKTLLISAAGFVAVVVIWQVIAVGPMAGGPLPTVPAVADNLVTVASTQAFWSSVAATVGIALLGLVSSAIAGVVLGLLVGSFEPFRYATMAVLEFLKPIPPIVILPLVVLVAGPTTKMTWFLVFLGCLLPIIMQTVDGVHDTDPVALDTARSYGLKRPEIMARVVLPSAMPYIGTAMRVTAPSALIITVVAGLLGGGPGLGLSIYQAQSNGNFAMLYALVIVLGILGLLFQGGTRLAEGKILHWHESFREVAV